MTGRAHTQNFVVLLASPAELQVVQSSDGRQMSKAGKPHHVTKPLGQEGQTLTLIWG